MAIRDEELETLRRLSPKSLPDNPSQSGFSTSQIKEKFYLGLEYLYELLSNAREKGELTEQQLDLAKQEIDKVKLSVDKEIGDRNVAVRNLEEQLNTKVASLIATLNTKADNDKIIKTYYSAGVETLSELFEMFKHSVFMNMTMPFILNYNNVYYYCAIKKIGIDFSVSYSFEFENALDNATYIGNYATGSLRLNEIINNGSQFKQEYVVTQALEPYATKTDLTTKADLDSNGKVPMSQLYNIVDDIIAFENDIAHDINDENIAQYFTNGYSNLSGLQTLFFYLSMNPSEATTTHTGFEDLGYFFFKETDQMGDVRIAVTYIYHFVKHEDDLWYLERLTKEESIELTSTANILLCHRTNKQYRSVNKAIPFTQWSWSGDVYDFENKNVFAEIVSTLALGETSSTAFAGNRGKALETRMTSVESSVANIPNEIEEQIFDKLGSNKMQYLTREQFEEIKETIPDNVVTIFYEEM